MDAEGKHTYLSVLRVCNNLVHHLGRNLWAKFVPGDSVDGDVVNLSFDVQPGDSTPRRVMVCLAKQAHNFKCVAKVLERVREAEKFLGDVEEELEGVNPFDVNMALLTSLNSHVTVLSKCESAMQRRQSVRHRVVRASAGSSVNCFPLCDIECRVLGLSLSQLDSFTLLDNADPQWWLVRDRQGRRLRVPPLFLGIDSETAEVRRVRRVKDSISSAIHGIHSQVAAQLLQASHKLQLKGEEMQMLLQSKEQVGSFVYRLKLLDKYMRMYSRGEESGFSDTDFTVMQDTIGFVMDRVSEQAVPFAVSTSPIAAEVVKLRKGLAALRHVARSQEAAQRSRRRQQHSSISSSLRSGRSHRLSESHRRTSVFEFEFEFVESTRRVSSTRRERPLEARSRSNSSSSNSSVGRRSHSEILTRQRQQVQRKFVIRSVWDGQREVSLQEAAGSGLICFARGAYRDPDTGREVPLESAMAAGRIKVDFTSSKKLSEDTSAYGLIQLEEVKEVADTVVHPDSGRRLAADEAAACGVLDASRQHVLQSGGRRLGVREAARQGVATLTSQTVVVSYVIHAVVDVKAKKKLSFQEAAEAGLVDRETGDFSNSATGETLPPADAIKHGFLKAYSVEDPKSLHIEPENRISVNQFQKLKSRWHAVNAFSRSIKAKDATA